MVDREGYRFMKDYHPDGELAPRASALIEIDGVAGAFSAGGDSGSVIWRSADRAPLGLLFAVAGVIDEDESKRLTSGIATDHRGARVRLEPEHRERQSELVVAARLGSDQVDALYRPRPPTPSPCSATCRPAASMIT